MGTWARGAWGGGIRGHCYLESASRDRHLQTPHPGRRSAGWRGSSSPAPSRCASGHTRSCPGVSCRAGAGGTQAPPPDGPRPPRGAPTSSEPPTPGSPPSRETPRPRVSLCPAPGCFGPVCSSTSPDRGPAAGRGCLTCCPVPQSHGSPGKVAPWLSEWVPSPMGCRCLGSERHSLSPARSQTLGWGRSRD